MPIQHTVAGTKKKFGKSVTIDKAVIKFKVDTEAEVTVISEARWITLNIPEPLQKPSSSLCDPDHTPLKVLGEVLLSHIQGDTACNQSTL